MTGFIRCRFEWTFFFFNNSVCWIIQSRYWRQAGQWWHLGDWDETEVGEPVTPLWGIIWHLGDWYSQQGQARRQVIVTCFTSVLPPQERQRGEWSAPGWRERLAVSSPEVPCQYRLPSPDSHLEREAITQANSSAEPGRSIRPTERELKGRLQRSLHFTQ